MVGKKLETFLTGLARIWWSSPSKEAPCDTNAINGRNDYLIRNYYTSIFGAMKFVWKYTGVESNADFAYQRTLDFQLIESYLCLMSMLKILVHLSRKRGSKSIQSGLKVFTLWLLFFLVSKFPFIINVPVTYLSGVVWKSYSVFSSNKSAHSDSAIFHTLLM